jgi:hypothetical protein
VGEVVRLAPHEKMRPVEALACSSAEEWEAVIICGYHPGDDGLIVRSSAMTREQALWIIEHCRAHVLGFD